MNRRQMLKRIFMANVVQTVLRAPGVPEPKTYLLKRGERSLKPADQSDLTKFLNAGKQPFGKVAIYLDGKLLGMGIGKLSR